MFGIKRMIVNFFRKQAIKRKVLRSKVHYFEIENKLKISKARINFAAYVVFDSTYGIDNLFKMMIKDNIHWNPKIVIIPDTLRGKENARKTYNKTKEFFINKYGNDFILDGWNCDNDEYYDLLSEFDMVYYANPYDAMVHRYHSIEYGAENDVLPIIISYGYDVGRNTTLSRLQGIELNIAWKIFTDTTFSYADCLKYMINGGENVVLSGYAKMDNYVISELESNELSPNKKRILITPHHTIDMEGLPLSNFIKYKEFILDLPDIFPEIEFILRPHPLLFTTMINKNIWSKEECKKYINKLKEKGIKHSVEGGYLHLFNECDAIINDCGSFTVEWMFTGKPGCFVYNDKLSKNHLTDLMNNCIKTYTIARNERDIISFIQNVVDGKLSVSNDTKLWAKNNIFINHPNVSDFIFDKITLWK